MLAMVNLLALELWQLLQYSYVCSSIMSVHPDDGGSVRDARVSLANVDVVSRLVNTTTEQAFGPGHLSRLPLGPGPKSALVPGLMASRAAWGHRGLLSRLEPPTRTKGPTFVPVGGSNWDH